MSLTVEIRKKLAAFDLALSFSSAQGTLGLLGASGCGKSYTLKCIAGIETPDEGRIILDGRTLLDTAKHINLPPQQRHVGYLFQNYALFPNMTVRQNILCGLRREPDRARRQAKLQEVLQLLQLQAVADSRPARLSGGEAQRAALARILVSQPQLLLLDEPFAALDTHLRDRLQVELEALLEQLQQPAILVTHSRDEAYHLCRQIAVIDQGQLLTLKNTDALFADPGSPRAAVLTGCKNITPARAAGPRLIELPDWGIKLTTQQPVAPGLTAAGIRAHAFDPAARTNYHPVAFERPVEEPFEWTLPFRWQGQAPASQPVWWRVPKRDLTQPLPPGLGVDPEQILLLYD
ncbi:MAG: ATP-binding cassette domain-containing protein [Oscillospiraceae bacterium]|nr:ATP-binding cassette domain-containing protein [Oscillospiraceae bacterium]MDD4368696.1 ATP-binding cassette domain-containing protein [Oscillospiraceae bacterium]